MGAILQVFYSIFSGILLSLAIPNEIYLLGQPFIAFFAIFPYYLAIKNSKSYRFAFLLGFLQSCTTHLCSSFWLANFKDFAALTLGASAFGTALQGAIFGSLLYLPFAEKKERNSLNENSIYFSVKIPFRVLYFAALYTLYEWVKSSSFLGYPWGTISTTMFRFESFKQIAAITGTYGLTFLTVFFNALLAEFLILTFYNDDFDLLNLNTNNLNQKNRWFFWISTFKTFLILFLLVNLYGLVQININRKPQKIVTSIIVQQNSDSWEGGSDNNTILTSQELTNKELEKLKTLDKKADVVLWSEGSLKYMFPSSYSHYKSHPEKSPFVSFVKKIKTPVITGGSYVKNSDLRIYNNAALLFDADGNFRGYYGKNHLVPFAEAIPGMEIPEVKKFMQKIIGISSGWTPGDQYVNFEIPCKPGEVTKFPASKTIDITKSYAKQKDEENAAPTVKISAPICYDDSFPDVIRPMFLSGTELFMNITDDSWSQKKSSEYQHFVVASFRPIEYRTTLVRSTNSGYTVVLGPTGNILADLPLFEKGALTYDVPVYERKMTTYARYGNWLPHILVILTFITWIYYYLNFTPSDYIPSQRKIKKHKKHDKKKK